MNQDAKFIQASTMLPPEAHIIVEDIKVGDYVKVCVEIHNHTEKFWGIVDSIHGDDIVCRTNQDMVLSKYHDIYDTSMFSINRYLILGVMSNAD